MGIFESLFGGRPAVPPVTEIPALVAWFLKYDERVIEELGASYGDDFYHIVPEIIERIEGGDTAEKLASHVAALMGQHNVMLISLANDGQLTYAFTPAAASFKLTCAKIRITLRIAGYVLLKKYSVDICEIPVAYPEKFAVSSEDKMQVIAANPEIAGFLY